MDSSSVKLGIALTAVLTTRTYRTAICIYGTGGTFDVLTCHATSTCRSTCISSDARQEIETSLARHSNNDMLYLIRVLCQFPLFLTSCGCYRHKCGYIHVSKYHTCRCSVQKEPEAKGKLP